MRARLLRRAILGPILVVLGYAAGPARAQPAEPARDPGLERAFAAELATRDPRLAESFAAATRLLDQGRMAEAEASFKAIAQVAPRHAPTQWRLSAIARDRGDRDQAITRARLAVAASGAWQAKTTLAEALLLDLSKHPDDGSEVGRLIDELEREHPGLDTSVLAAAAASERQNLAELRDAVQELARYAPDDQRTHYFMFVLRGTTGDLGEADEELSRAVAAGFPAAAADQLREQSGIASRHRAWRWAERGAVALGVWLLGLLVIFTLGSAMSRSTLGAVERFDGRDREGFRATTRRLRQAYAWLIGATAVYYYVSVPIVIAIVLLLAGGAIFGALMMGHVPIKLLMLIAIVALVSVWAMLRSLFVRRGQQPDPGRPLAESEAPALWSLLREVAGRTGTRPVDAVYLTLATEVAVIERGTLAARLRDAGKRALILGVGALDGLTRQQLRAILAHEYGHFSHRDTAGGDLAMMVQSSLLGSIVRMARTGGATAYNPAWHFVRGFYALFLRTTLGASRLREIMADQTAAVAYGARAFADGLTHIVRRTLEFDRNVDLLAKRAQAEARPIGSLYAAPDDPPDNAGGATNATDTTNPTNPANANSPTTPGDQLEAELKKRLAEPGSPYDSHPPPGSRIAWISKLASQPTEADTDGDQPAWTLFADRAALEREMTALANRRLQERGVFTAAPPAVGG